MRFLPAVTILTVVLHSTVARYRRRPSPVMGTLQSLLSPANAERTMQMLQMATQNTIGNAIGNCNPPWLPNSPVKYSPPIIPLPEPCNLPLSLQIPMPNPNALVLPNPNPLPVQIPAPVPLPTPYPVSMPNPISYQMPVQLTSPPLPVQLPNSIPIQLPCQVTQYPVAPISIPEIIIDVPSCPYEREIVYPSADVPSYVYSPPAPIIPEVVTPIALTSAEDIYSCPIPSPAALFTFPAALPSCCAPEPGCKSQYLRKIPIPPPTL